MENQNSTQPLILSHFVGNGGYQQIMCGYSQQGVKYYCLIGANVT